MKTPEKLLSNQTLFIDTSSEYSRIVFFSDQKIVFSKKWKGKGELSDKLLKKIDLSLSEFGIQKETIKQIAVFSGPGSYTGLRIGITCANFLAWSLKIPVFSANKKAKIIAGKKDFILPIYFADARITSAKNK
jgi:tRNA threonylcarbamoyladenosine biosynthesis protein TsaB